MPFVVTMVTTIFISSYLLLDPAHWLFILMGLTYISWDFKLFILGIAVAGFALMYISELWLFPRMARWIGDLKTRFAPKRRRKRKEYKIIAESMRM